MSTPRNAELVVTTAGRVVDRIKATAKNRGEDTQKLIIRFVLERFLSRYVQVRQEAKTPITMTLKGGMLMLDLNGDCNRPTQDIDGSFDCAVTEAEVREFVQLLCATAPTEEDGIVFDASNVTVREIRDGLLPGFKVEFEAAIVTKQYGRTRVPMNLDLCWNDVITPAPRTVTLPCAIKGFEPVEMAAYPYETVFAEKVHAIARHGLGNTRAKDFYDLVLLARLKKDGFDGKLLSQAVRATFAAWGGAVATADLPGLSQAYAASKQGEWAKLTGKKVKLDLGKDFGPIVEEVAAFVKPVLEAAARGEDLDARWIPGEGWNLAPTNAMTMR